MNYKQCATRTVLITLLVSATVVVSQTRKEFHYTVQPHASISIVNQYGPVTVSPSQGNQVSVIVVLHSDKVEIDQNQNAHRVQLITHLLPGSTADSGRV